MGVNKAPDEFDIEAVAEKAIERLSVGPKQVIAIWAGTQSLDLVEALAFRIRQRGAFWTLRLTMDSLLRRLGKELAEGYLDAIPQHELRWLADINAIISVRDQAGNVPGVPLARRRKMMADRVALIDEATRRGCRQLVVANPTRALAATYGVALADLRQAYWHSILINEAELRKDQQKAKARLGDAKEVHILSPLGTDLRLRIDRRRPYLDEDSIPGGEVYLAPHEESAEGVAVIDRMLVKGKPVEKVRFTFAAGRVVSIEGPGSSASDLQELLAASSGDKDVIAEFAVGLNPGLAAPIGDPMLDEKIRGLVHIAIGRNDRYGGRNRSNLHLDLLILQSTVQLDGATIIRDRVLTL